MRLRTEIVDRNDDTGEVIRFEAGLAARIVDIDPYDGGWQKIEFTDGRTTVVDIDDDEVEVVNEQAQ